MTQHYMEFNEDRRSD